MLEQLRWIKHWIDRLFNRPTTIIAKTTTPLGAGAEFTTGKFDVGCYDRLVVYAWASHEGYFYIRFFNSEDKLLRAHSVCKIGAWDNTYSTKTIGTKADVVYLNGDTAQTGFLFVVEGARR